MKNKKYLFVCGCPRSGTSAFARYLLSTGKVAIFMERYQAYWRKFNRFPENAFHKDKINNVEEGETHYTEISRFSENMRALEIYDEAEFIGDKIPSLYENFHSLFLQFPNIKIFCLYRDPFSIAESYKKRALDPEDKNWGAHRGVLHAIHDFNRYIKSIVDLYNQEGDELFFKKVFIVNYELFALNSINTKHLNLFLESNLTFPIVDFKQNYQIFKKPQLLTPVEKKEIVDFVDWDFVKEVNKILDKQRLYYYRREVQMEKIRKMQWYHKEDFEKLGATYGEFSIEGCPYVFRGSKLPIKDNYAVCLGSAFTFGRLIKKPYPEILEEQIGIPFVNLGIGGARPSVYLCYPSIIDFCKEAELVICEIMSARGYTNPIWEERFPFSNFGYVKIPSSVLNKIQNDKDFKIKWLIEKAQKSEAIFFDRLEILYNYLEFEDLQNIREILLRTYINDFLFMLKSINRPTILLYLNKRKKRFASSHNSKPSSYHEWTGDFPHFVDEIIIQVFKDSGYEIIEINSSEGIPFEVRHWETGELVNLFPWNDPSYLNTYYPSQEIHNITADILLQHPWIIKLKSSQIGG